VSITQSTELGTLHTPDEIRALADQAHAHGMLLHVDGARLANAAAALGMSLSALTTDVGVDALSFGGTKNGLLLGEAVVFLRAGLGDDVAFLRKQSMQLASKMRFLAAQFEVLLSDSLWLRPATHANEMAARLASAVTSELQRRIPRADLDDLRGARGEDRGGIHLARPRGFAQGPPPDPPSERRAPVVPHAAERAHDP